MNVVYNSQDEIASNIVKILKKCGISRKTQLNIIPYIIIGMILSGSTVASDIARKLKGNFSLIQHDSIIKRIKRFFTNKLFNPYDFYDKIIRYVISNYTVKHSDKRVHIIFDHMFSHDNYTVFMITMRIGKQGIPLWFRCYKGNDDPKAFDEEMLKQGITYASSLFPDDYDLIFLADRWFNSTSLLNHIDSLGRTYVVRLKGNIRCFVYDKKEGHKIWKNTGDLFTHESKSTFYDDILITNNQFKTNIVLSKKKEVKEPWIIATNGDTKRAIKDYGYRFGGIETVFKNQKSNGFYLESTVKADIKYFESMYTMACFSVLFLTIFGTDYTKNSKSYKSIKLTTHKKIKGVKTRVMSFFNVGLTLFNKAIDSLKYIRIPYTLKLYDA